MVANPILITSRVAHAYVVFFCFFLCVYAHRNCLQNVRSSLLYAIYAKYHFDITFPNSFRNIERPKIIDTKILYILCFIFGGGCGAGGEGGGSARQDYFTHFEPSQSLDAAKTGDPQNKPPGHPQAELGLSHM